MAPTDGYNKRVLAASLLALSAMSSAAASTAPESPSERSARSAVAYGPNRLVGVLRDVAFPAGRSERIIRNVSPGFAFTEIIPSWNIEGAGAIRLDVRVPREGGGMSKWYTFGTWSPTADWAVRESVNGQGDADGNVLTDTFRAKGRPRRADLRIVLLTRNGSQRPRLKHLSLAFTDTAAPFLPDSPDRSAWGRNIEVPAKLQYNYPRGAVLCSATVTSMLLTYYAGRLERPELEKDVPEVENRVWDKVYSGAGNWPFNAAYVGSFPGMRAYISRFDGIADIERITKAGYPVGASVAYSLLKGRPLSATEQGHLVIVTGFTPEGDVMVNDSASREAVRRTYPRADFEKGWDYSRHLVYLDLPEGATLPPDPKGLWTPFRR